MVAPIVQGPVLAGNLRDNDVRFSDFKSAHFALGEVRGAETDPDQAHFSLGAFRFGAAYAKTTGPGFRKRDLLDRTGEERADKEVCSPR